MKPDNAPPELSEADREFCDAIASAMVRLVSNRERDKFAQLITVPLSWLAVWVWCSQVIGPALF